MDWGQIRDRYPDQWLVVETLKSRSEGTTLFPTELEVVARCNEGRDALDTYRRLHLRHPDRDFLFVHTSREALAIELQSWVGVRPSHAT